MLRLVDAARCPYCARVRMVLAEKGFELEVLSSLLARAPYLSGSEFGLADTGYLPWVLRARDRMDVDRDYSPAVVEWVARCSERPSVAAELDMVASL